MTRLLMEWLPLPDVGFDGMIFVFGVIFLMLFVSWLHEVGKKTPRVTKKDLSGINAIYDDMIKDTKREEKKRREEAREHTCEQNRKRQKEREEWKKSWEAYKQRVEQERLEREKKNLSERDSSL